MTLPDPEVSQDLNSDVIGVINSSHSIGQTIKTRRDNFNGITIWTSVDMENLEDSPLHEQILIVNLYTYPEPSTLINQTRIRLELTPDIRPVTISFTPQLDTTGKSYLLRLSTNSGSIKVFGRNEDIYPNGQAFADAHGISGDIAFTTTYEYDGETLLNDVKHWIESTWLIFPLSLMLLVPGLLLLTLSKKDPTYDFNQKIGISIGLSLAIIPVLLLWTSTVGILWNKNFVYFSFGFFTAILLFLHIRKRLLRTDTQITGVRERIVRGIPRDQFFLKIREKTGSLLIPIALVSIFFLALTIRLIMVRDLATPAWVDSVHHGLVTRIILETGALPETYLPYLNIEPTFYHPGFHSQLATFQLITDLDIHLAMLIFGQIINALMVFAVYALAVSMTHNPIIGLFSAIITGLFTPMPAYYTSWGRYTQLSGLMLLVVAYILFKQAIQRTDKKLFSTELVIASIITGGLFLTHYRATAFLILFIIADLIVRYAFFRKINPFSRLQFFRLLLFMLLSALLVLPWLIQSIPNTFLVSLSQPVPNETNWFADFSWRFLNAAWGKQALVLGVLGLLWGLIQRKRFAWVLFIWVGLLTILANMSVLGIPGGGYINTTSIEISLFIPISILAGYFIVELIHTWKLVLPDKLNQVFLVSTITITLLLSVIGAQTLTSILNPVTFLSRNADILAINWLKDNIPREEKILINPFLWGYGLYAGNDGGYWITPLSGRLTIPPPALYALSPEEELNMINQTSQFMIDHGRDAEGLHGYMTKNDYSYIYLGARGGPISPEALDKFHGFINIYDVQGVRIFKISP